MSSARRISDPHGEGIDEAVDVFYMRFPWRLPRRAALVVALVLAGGIVMAAAGRAQAQGSLDLYGGAAMNGTADVRISETRSSGTTSAEAAIDLSTSVEFGYRLQGWLPSHEWFGLAMDVGYYQADGEGVDIDVIPLSFAATVRAPLFATPNRPEGRLQPYVMGGVTFHMVDIAVNLEGMSGDSFRLGWPLPGADELVLGPYLAGGLAWQPAKRWALFGEYRYSTFDVGFDTTNSLWFPTMNGRVDAEVEREHVLVGIGYRLVSEPR